LGVRGMGVRFELLCNVGSLNHFGYPYCIDKVPGTTKPDSKSAQPNLIHPIWVNQVGGTWDGC
jgi:hypothetical protein